MATALQILDQVIAEKNGTAAERDVMSRIMACESGGRNIACELGGSAAGLYQMVTGTWNQQVAQHADLRGADRNDPRAQTLAAFYLIQSNANSLQGAGLEANATNIYLAHFLGAGGAIAALKAGPGTHLSDVTAEVRGHTVHILRAAENANPHIKGMTVGQLTAWAAGKMGKPISLSGSTDLEEERGAREQFLRDQGMSEDAIKHMDIFGKIFAALFMSIMDKVMAGTAPVNGQAATTTVAQNDGQLPSPQTPPVPRAPQQQRSPVPAHA